MNFIKPIMALSKKLLLLVSVLTLCSWTELALASFAQRTEVQAFIKNMHNTHGFETQALKNLFQHVESNPKILAVMSRPYEAKPWDQYRVALVSEQRAKEGLAFWKQHEALLNKAQAEFGVPAEIIIAILGVETFYGKNMGHFPVLEALATLAFDYPPRSAFFKKELEEYLQLCRENNWDPRKINGSYAGAMGKAQFISSSYRRYALDYSKTGQRDLIHDTADAIGSIAHYFKSHGWQPGLMIAEKVAISKHLRHKLPKAVDKNPKPAHTLAELNGFGLKIQAKRLKAHQSIALLELKTQTDPEHWLGTQNFYVITRYNHSTNYAMAVFQLSERIRQMRDNIAKVVDF